LDSISDEMMQERSLQTGATPTEKKIWVALLLGRICDGWGVK
jgi:hypothetical protein